MKQSAGILLYRRLKSNGVEVFLVHPGGPFWAKKDTGAWSIPKGEFEEGEEPLAAAKREFSEELGIVVPAGELYALDPVKQSGGKVVYAWALEGDPGLDPAHITSNTFEIEWPPRSGKMQTFPEVDKAAWFDLSQAQARIVKGQLPFLQKLAGQLQILLPEPPAAANGTSVKSGDASAKNAQRSGITTNTHQTSLF